MCKSFIRAPILHVHFILVFRICKSNFTADSGFISHFEVGWSCSQSSPARIQLRVNRTLWFTIIRVRKLKTRGLDICTWWCNGMWSVSKVKNEHCRESAQWYTISLECNMALTNWCIVPAKCNTALTDWCTVPAECNRSLIDWCIVPAKCNTALTDWCTVPAKCSTALTDWCTYNACWMLQSSHWHCICETMHSTNGIHLNSCKNLIFWVLLSPSMLHKTPKHSN